ncbi:DUF4917 family protein [Serratia symbiotica]|uniref:DUF4917 family protein n=1 Tax=Serratia symbiotica TaxID=138074 RepID=UPI003463FA49
MPYKIHNWADIAKDYNEGSLLLGNGASIAIDNRFKYSSIIEHARDEGYLTEDVQKLFEFYETEDFELVLRFVWQASNVNQALQIQDKKTNDAYKQVRSCLIQSVRDIHPDYNEISNELPAIYKFIKNFKTVISLNYDLIVYWALMYGNEQEDTHQFKDCYINGFFDEDWSKLKNPTYGYKSTTLVFYPHGTLYLSRNKVEHDIKLKALNDGPGLLQSILKEWEEKQTVPLFVCEGTSNQKINSINNSIYLNTVYREVLTSLEPCLVIYGWSLSSQDEHILKRIKLSKRKLEKVAVSVHNNDQEYSNRVRNKIHKILGDEVQVVFFHSDSSDCWNNNA